MTAPKHHRQWLREELPDLVAAGVLDPAIAERLAQHYALPAGTGGTDRSGLRTLVLGLLGCLLVGAGVILLFAHNWDELSRQARAAASLGQLLLAQAAAAYALLRRPTRAWLESTGALLTLSVGAAIALISQTYHLEGELGDFMLVWVALAAPLAHVLGARSVATLVLLGAPVLAFERSRALDGGYAYFAALLAVAPALQLRRMPSELPGLVVLARWAFAITLPIAGAAFVVDQRGGLWLPFYAGLAACFIALEPERRDPEASATQRALGTVGALGTVLLTLVLSYEDAAGGLRDEHAHSLGFLPSWTPVAAIALTAGMALAAAALAYRTREQTSLRARLLLGCNAALFLIYAADRALVAPAVLALLASALLLALGALLLAQGLRTKAMALANQGLGVLALLFFARFFDTELSFIVRGLGFVVLGLAFLGVNIALSRARKHEEPAR